MKQNSMETFIPSRRAAWINGGPDPLLRTGRKRSRRCAINCAPGGQGRGHGLCFSRVQWILFHTGLHHPASRPVAPPLTGQPGPFRGQPEVLEQALADAGFKDIHVVRGDTPVRLTSAAECLQFKQESYGALHQMPGAFPISRWTGPGRRSNRLFVNSRRRVNSKVPARC